MSKQQTKRHKKAPQATNVQEQPSTARGVVISVLILLFIIAAALLYLQQQEFNGTTTVNYQQTKQKWYTT